MKNNNRVCFYVINNTNGEFLPDELFDNYNEFRTMAAACAAARKVSKVVAGDISVTVCINNPVYNAGKMIEE